jgi:superfamily II DNA or RNA helicase
VLLGLTATPERADGRDVTSWFGGRISVELRLWKALARGLLCPFPYFGVHDSVDVSGVPWRRGTGYHLAGLSNVYTGHDARARTVAQAVLDKVADVAAMRAIGFCVSIDHAEFMARRFNDFGIPAWAVSTQSSQGERLAALRALRNGTTKILFAVDLLTEGVDVPEVDTVLFLRPTQSPTVFLQQLGRNLAGELEGLGDAALATLLDEVGLEAEDLYRSSRGGWTQLRREAGLETAPPHPGDDRLAGAPRAPSPRRRSGAAGGLPRRADRRAPGRRGRAGAAVARQWRPSPCGVPAGRSTPSRTIWPRW